MFVIVYLPEDDRYQVRDLDGTVLHEGSNWGCCAWLSDYLENIRKDEP